MSPHSTAAAMRLSIAALLLCVAGKVPLVPGGLHDISITSAVDTLCIVCVVL